MMNVIYLLFSYLIGAISFGIVMSHLFSLPDPRTIGSKNPGATNVLRTGKKLAALLTLLGDALKGALTVGLAQYFELSSLMVGLIAIATLIGHVFPIYYGFKGGKGVATAAGILFMFSLSLIHISEPTRQAEISYAVFCLKKKNCNRKIIPQLWICMQQYLLEPSEME